jgi:hypothetical protein
MYGKKKSMRGDVTSGMGGSMMPDVGFPPGARRAADMKARKKRKPAVNQKTGTYSSDK